MKKALFAGILASFFFAFTFILNRSMHLGGGSWVWSACLRYYFTLPILWAVLLFQGKGGLGRIFREIRRQPLTWLWWSTVGFGLFYAPLSLGSQYGEAWLTAATWLRLCCPFCWRRCAIRWATANSCSTVRRRFPPWNGYSA